MHKKLSAVLIVVTACGATCPGLALAQASVSVHLTMGNPSKATADETNRDDFLVVEDEYCYSYNARTGLANWVSWRLAGDDIGKADRGGLDFTADPKLPAGFGKPADVYPGSGFDKGHWLSSKNRSASSARQRKTFRYPNCGPQAPRLNRGQWKQREEAERTLALGGKELYTIAGPAGRGGKGERGWRQVLTEEKVPPWSRAPIGNGFEVPAYCWAVSVILDEQPGDDLERVTADTPVLAVIMPNHQDIAGDWTAYKKSIDEVEQLTGFDFFSLVDAATQRAIEKRKPAK